MPFKHSIFVFVSVSCVNVFVFSRYQRLRWHRGTQFGVPLWRQARAVQLYAMCWRWLHTSCSARVLNDTHKIYAICECVCEFVCSNIISRPDVPERKMIPGTDKEERNGIIGAHCILAYSTPWKQYSEQRFSSKMRGLTQWISFVILYTYKYCEHAINGASSYTMHARGAPRRLPHSLFLENHITKWLYLLIHIYLFLAWSFSLEFRCLFSGDACYCCCCNGCHRRRCCRRRCCCDLVIVFNFIFILIHFDLFRQSTRHSSNNQRESDTFEKSCRSDWKIVFLLCHIIHSEFLIWRFVFDEFKWWPPHDRISSRCA